MNYYYPRGNRKGPLLKRRGTASSDTWGEEVRMGMVVDVST